MPYDLEVKFFDPNRQLDDVYDFMFKGVEIGLLQDLKKSFIDLTGAYARRSRRQAWRSIRKFIEHLARFGTELDPNNMLDSFAKSLTQNELMSKTNGSHYNFVRRTIRWLAINDLNPVWKSQTYAYYNFPREDYSVRSNSISGEELAKIVAACKKEIKSIRENISVRYMIERGDAIVNSSLSLKEAANLKKLIQLERQGVWSQLQISGVGMSTLSHSGLRKLEPFKELTSRTILPIFLLMMIETAANPVALMEIRTSCIGDHPTDESLAVISWDKPRARKEQRVSCLRAGAFSVIQLVDLVVSATNHLRIIASDADKDILFITRLGSISKRISVQGFHNGLAEFRLAHDLPRFTFSDIRKAVAGIINENFGSPRVVAEFLQHSNMSTVGLYLKNQSSQQKSFERVSEFQGKIIETIEAKSSSEKTSPTMFGLECSSPNSGDMPGSKLGQPCLEFTKCAGCKHAIVITDEPLYIARILRAKLHLEEMRLDSFNHTDSIERFGSTYQATLDVITFKILPKIQKAVLKQAEAILPNIPRLPRFY